MAHFALNEPDTASCRGVLSALSMDFIIELDIIDGVVINDVMWPSTQWFDSTTTSNSTTTSIPSGAHSTPHDASSTSASTSYYNNSELDIDDDSLFQLSDGADKLFGDMEAGDLLQQFDPDWNLSESDRDVVGFLGLGDEDLDVLPSAPLPVHDDVAEEDVLGEGNSEKRHKKKGTPQKKAHTGDKPHKCKICGAGFGTGRHQLRNLLRHMKTVHTGDKSYQCSLCEKAFNRKDSLGSHMRSHTDEKKYQCNQCGKAFKRKVGMESHKRIVHAGVKPYPCNQCDRAFGNNENLKAHMFKHTGVKRHQCNQCDKGFSARRHLVKHLKKDHGGSTTLE